MRGREPEEREGSFKQVSREGVILRGHLSEDLKKVRGAVQLHGEWRFKWRSQEASVSGTFLVHEQSRGMRLWCE